MGEVSKGIEFIEKYLIIWRPAMYNKIYNFNKNVLKFMRMIIKNGIKVNENLNGIVLKKVDYLQYPQTVLVDKMKMGEKWNQNTWNQFYDKCCKDEYLGYYWFEFKIHSDEYRITMFVKDFDEGAGNIHTLPGMIQIWYKYQEKEGIDEKKLFFSVKKNVITRVPYRIKKERERESYRSTGGINFQEGKWIPLFKENTANSLCIWDISANIEIYESIISSFWKINQDSIKTDIKGLCTGKNAYMLYGDSSNINLLYKNNKNVGKAKKCGKYTYILYKWDDKENCEMQAYYKHMWIEDEEAYFVVFDGENHMHSTEKNICGPNYIDKGKWIISYE